VALCRLLLSDFLCADYDLPKDCSFLLQEVELWMTTDHSDDDEESQDEPEDHEILEGSSEICDGERCWMI
jgi:DNA-binding transcriptional regulator/RsmH inhibitor MraZ